MVSVQMQQLAAVISQAKKSDDDEPYMVEKLMKSSTTFVYNPFLDSEVKLAKIGNTRTDQTLSDRSLPHRRNNIVSTAAAFDFFPTPCSGCFLPLG